MFDAKLMDVANALAASCREGREKETLDTLYAAEAVSVEAAPMPGEEGTEIVGIAAIRGKHDWWESTYEMTDAKVEGPFLHGADRFALIFEAKTRHKETGEAMHMREIGLYTVADGKIVREEFFYAI